MTSVKMAEKIEWDSPPSGLPRACVENEWYMIAKAHLSKDGIWLDLWHSDPQKSGQIFAAKMNLESIE